MNTRSKRVVIFGHSHAARLGRILNRFHNGQLLAQFNVNNVSVTCEGRGGLHVKDLVDESSQHCIRFNNIMTRTQPQILCLLVGCNDVDRYSSAEEIASLMETVASVLWHKNPSLVRIVFTQLLPRLRNRWVDHELYNAQATQINVLMRQWGARCPYGLFLWCKVRFPTSPLSFINLRRMMISDGVHLNRLGYHKLYRALRYVVILAAQL